jgi:outer membrane lipoprotein-sorting protein
MKFLRTVSTQRLLAIIAGVVVAIAGCTAIAVAAAGSGPVPPHKRLAQAIHDALAAPSVPGITARISFKNHLIDSSELQGSDPILTGATGRLWLSNGGRVRLELQSSSGQDAQVVAGDGSFWVYDPSSNTVYKGKLPSGSGTESKRRAHEALPSVAQIQSDLNRLMAHLNVSGAIPSDVAGRAAYTARVSPQHDGGLLGAAELAWDAAHGVPMRFALYARGDKTPVLEVAVTNISFARVPALAFSAAPPTGAKTVTVSAPNGRGLARGRAAKRGANRHHAEVTGAAAVARHLSFKLLAPTSLVGLPRKSVSLLNWGGSPAALVLYGQNLGGIVVIEQTARSTSTAAKPSGGGNHRGLNLPTVSINGATGQELSTAIGSVVRFTRGSVTYTVLGSVPAAAAEAAARGL